MGLTVQVGVTLTDLGTAQMFARLLNWVAAQRGAREGRYDTLLSVRPTEDEFTGARLVSLAEELATLSGHPPSQEALREVLRALTDAAREAAATGANLDFL